MAFESGETDGHDFAFKVVGIVVVFLMLGTFLESMGFSHVTNLFPKDLLNNQNSEEVNDKKDLNFTEAILGSNLDLGEKVLNSKTLTVYNAPAGNPLGKQKKGAKGRIMEGPANAANLKWWRVDYENAPSGWVDDLGLTNKVGIFTLLNIIPITLSFLTPIAIGISVLILILMVVTIFKILDLNKIIQKKNEQKKEQEIYSRRDDTPSTPVENETVLDNKEDLDDWTDQLPVPNLPVGKKPVTEAPSNRRWSHIQTQLKSYNQNDWKQAIIEADTILEEMLEKIGYEGNSIGDRLKQVNPSDFLTLNSAWEAHKVRNKIAHGGSDFTMSRDEAERVVGLYKDVFKEFFYI